MAYGPTAFDSESSLLGIALLRYIICPLCLGYNNFENLILLNYIFFSTMNGVLYTVYLSEHLSTEDFISSIIVMKHLCTPVIQGCVINTINK